MVDPINNNRLPVNEADDAMDIEAVPHKPVEEVEVDFEKIETEIGKMLIYIMRDRRNHFYVMSEVVSKDWKEQVANNAGSYSWKKWNVTLFPAAKIGLDVFTVTFIGFNTHRFDTIKPQVKMFEKGSGIVDTAKQFFDTIDTGSRTEGQARAEQLKLVFEKNEREAQNFDSQTAEAERKLAEARKKREDFEQAMAR